MLIIGLEWGSDQGHTDQDGSHRWRSKLPSHLPSCLISIFILFQKGDQSSWIVAQNQNRKYDGCMRCHLTSALYLGTPAKARGDSPMSRSTHRGPLLIRGLVRVV